MLKQRSTLAFQAKGNVGVYIGNAFLYGYTEAANMVVNQKTQSESHKWPLPKGKFTIDSGGAFQSWKSEVIPGATQVTVESNPLHVGVWYKYEGPIFAYFQLTQPEMTTYISPSTSGQLDALGTTAISRTLPTNPLSGMGQFLGELRQLPTIPDILKWRPRTGFFRGLQLAGKNWLNVVFGWLPFIKDVKDFSRTAKNSPAIIDQFVRNSGRLVRRRYHFPTSTTASSSVISTNAYGAPSLPFYLYSSPGVLTKSVLVKTETWFSGAYTYYLPGVEGPLNYMKSFESTAHRLYGLRLDPDLLWKLSPWSWAVDWVTNAGDVIRNFSAFSNDGLVLQYGYVMERKTITTVYTLNGLTLAGGRRLNLTQVITQTVKSRRKATPYGFGLDPGTFSPKQWSIIAALGISRAPRSLNF